MNIAIVDDWKADRERLARILQEYCAVAEVPVRIFHFESGEALTGSYFAYQYDMIFLDIYMGDGMTGIQTARIIREKDPEVLLVFLTTSGEHQAEAIHWHVFDYLNKEEMAEKVPAVLERAFRRQSGSASGQLSFISGKASVTVPYAELVCLTADRNYLVIHDSRGRQYRTRMTFSSVRETLQKDPRFLSVLRGVIVNMDYLTDISSGCCTLRGGIRLPVSLREKARLEQIWVNYSFAKIRRESLERS